MKNVSTDLALRGRRRAGRFHASAVQMRTAYLFILPSCVVLAVFLVWPIIDVIWLSLKSGSILSPSTQTFAGLANYVQLLQDPRFWNDLRVTLVYTLVVVPVTSALALGVALLVNEQIPFAQVLRSIYFFPAISSFAVMGIVWSFILNPQIGPVDYWLGQLHLPQPDWLQSVGWALPSVMFVGVWKNLGFNMVIFLAGLQGIPEIYYEAAKTDGARSWERFWHVTLPQLRPTTLFVVVTAVINSFQVFDSVYVMTQGGPLFSTEVLVQYMYEQAFQDFNVGYAAALAFVLFLVIAVISAFQLRLFRYSEVD